MRKAMLAGVMILAAAAAVGCSKKADKAGAPAGEGGQAAGQGSRPAGPFAPKRKAGLWQLTMSTTGGPGMSVNAQTCVDATSADDFNPQAGEASKNCSESTMTPTMGGWAFKSVCKMNGNTFTTEGKLTGDLSSDYAMEATSRMDPPTEGMPAESRTSVKAKWLGPCPAGMKPGEVSVKGMNLGG